jgi:hypothetical protein
VVFASLGSFVIANKGLKTFGKQRSSVVKGYYLAFLSTLIPIFGLFILVYIQSLSSIICAVVAVFYSFSSIKIFKKSNYVKWIFYTILIIFVVVLSWGYVMYRINTMGESTSLTQRFGFLFQLKPIDWIVGLKDASMLPETGIHNGAVLLIVISGIGGMAYLFYLLQHVFKSASIIGLSVYAVLLVLSVFMQNGGIFTPAKIVLISLVLLPLAAIRSAKKDLIKKISSGVVQ